MQTGLEQTCVAPSTPGLVGAGLKTLVQREASAAALCVCVWASWLLGKAHVGKRGIAWRGARREGEGAECGAVECSRFKPP